MSFANGHAPSSDTDHLFTSFSKLGEGFSNLANFLLCGYSSSYMSSPQFATFGAGCFWGVEETFRVLPGVLTTAVGYMGGSTPHPTYEEVCSDASGHAEVLQMTFDPDQISYQKLLDVFWNNHNPTTLNRQGPDVGTQYRSVIFFHTPEQETMARASKEALEGSRRFSQPIVTEIVPASVFHRAEEYHQRYLEKRGLGTCHL